MSSDGYKNPQMEIIRLRSLVISLENKLITKSNYSRIKELLDKNQELRTEIENYKQIIESVKYKDLVALRNANHELTVALLEYKERDDERNNILEKLLYAPVDNLK